MTLGQVMGLTPDQVMAELGGSDNAPKPIDVRAKAAQERADRFDRICNRLNTTPAKFATFPTDMIAREVRAEFPGIPVDVTRLPGWVAEYVRGKN